jgi:hypothetical protein
MLTIDLTAAARRADPEQVRAWLAEQRVFISSAMADTAAERESVAYVIEQEGARAVRFEELGRDASAEEVYLLGVESSTIYLAILNELYGTMLESGFSPTETEYMRARERGVRLAVYVAADASSREGHLRRFIDRVRVFVTTESYRDVDDLVRRVRRRLHELAAEALSPWVKLGSYVFRADLIDDRGDTVLVHARANDDISHAFEELRDRGYGRERLRLTYGSRVVDGDLATVRRTTHAGGASALEITLERVAPARGDAMRSGTSGMSADELVEAGIKRLFLGEALPASIGGLDFLADPGVDQGDLRQVFELPNEIVEAVTRLVVTEGLVGAGNASRIVEVSVGPLVGDARRIAVEWVDARSYANVEPARRRVEGDWRRRESLQP